jgi:TolB-like protein
LSRVPGPAVVTTDLPSIAVIAFSINTPHDDDLCLAEDISESIATGLTKFRDLRVVGPLVNYSNITMDAKEFAQRHGVRFLLHGKIQIQGDTLRIRASLLDTSTGFKVWSQIYEYTQTATNYLEIEKAITRQIVGTLTDHEGAIFSIISKESRQKHPSRLGFHDAVQRHEHFLKLFTVDAYHEAAEALELVTKADPNNAEALAMLSITYTIHYQHDMELSAPSLEEIERLAKRAVALDPECQTAHFAEAMVRFSQRQADRCIAKLRMANSLNSFTTYFIHGYEALLCMLGYWEEGMRLWKQAMRLNPHYPISESFVPFMFHYRHGDYKEAWNYAVRFNSHIFWDPLIRAAAAGQRGLHAEAKEALQELLVMRPDFPSRARELMRRVVYLDEHVTMLLDGLLKAGLKLEVSKN